MEEKLKEWELEELLALLGKPQASEAFPTTILQQWHTIERRLEQKTAVIQAMKQQAKEAEVEQRLPIYADVTVWNPFERRGRKEREQTERRSALPSIWERTKEQIPFWKQESFLDIQQGKDEVERTLQETDRQREQQKERLEQEVRSFFLEKEKETKHVSSIEQTGQSSVAFYNNITLQQGAGWQQLIQMLTEELEQALGAGCSGVHY